MSFTSSYRALWCIKSNNKLKMTRSTVQILAGWQTKYTGYQMNKPGLNNE